MKVKHILFLALFFGSFLTVRSQTFTLVDTGKVWSNTTCAWGWATMCGTQYYTISHDTVIGANAYKAVLRSVDSGLVNATWYVVGFIREDVSRKVYYRKLSDTTDYPIYDFGVNVGDTAHLVYGGFLPTDFVVDSITTIVLAGQTRNKYYLHDPTYQFYIPQVWIEGIGSTNELLVLEEPTVDYSSDLICFHEHDTLKYSNPNYTDCYYNTLGILEYKTGNQIHFSPNPTDGKFMIQFPANSTREITAVTISDISGKIILQQEIIPNEKPEMDLSAFPSGIYFVKISGKGLTPMFGKIAVE